MRFTIRDAQGGVSFIGACIALPALVAACSHNPVSVEQLLAHSEHYHPPLKEYVLSGLAIFDEHNASGNYAAIHEAISFAPRTEVPVFRIVDEQTLQTSLQPVKAGVILFNLPQKRIVQIQNSYSEIERTGRVKLPGTLFSRPKTLVYRLPADWLIVPLRLLYSWETRDEANRPPRRPLYGYEQPPAIGPMARKKTGLSTHAFGSENK